jgi:3-oxoacid CoA-transferase B subunit
MVKGMGGAMDLAGSGAKLIVCMEHVAKKAKKVLDKCTLPLTGGKSVTMLITDYGVFDFTRPEGMTLIEIADGVTLEQIFNASTAKFNVATNLKKMQQ